MSYNNASFSDSQEICNAFAKFFQSSFDSCSGDLNILTGAINSSFVPIQFSASEILNGLERLNTTGSSGPDGIVPLILNKCAQSLCEPLLHLFNRSLASGLFPDIWKKSFVIPIFKCNWSG